MNVRHAGGPVNIHKTDMADEKRPYRMTRRAEQEAATRLRITESAVALHGTLGPARTSVSAIADPAGVRRSTVYRHFPDEASLFAACTAHWAEANPPPDLGGWAARADPDERLRAALGELYAFYRATERMLTNVFRDESTVPSVAAELRRLRHYLEVARATLMAGRRVRGRARTRVQAALGHALAFPTWRSLAVDEGLDDDQAAELMSGLVAAAAATAPKARRAAAHGG
jgi:AcrR family transcriptional regulator